MADEEVEPEAAVLPAREAMSIISPGTGGMPMPDLAAVSESAPDAEGAAQTAATDAQGSASESESSSSEPQSHQSSNHDTASSTT